MPSAPRTDPSGAFELGGTWIRRHRHPVRLRGRSTHSGTRYLVLSTSAQFKKIVALIIFDTPPNLPGTTDFNPHLPVSPGLSQAGKRSPTRSHSAMKTILPSEGTTAFYQADRAPVPGGYSTGDRSKIRVVAGHRGFHRRDAGGGEVHSAASARGSRMSSLRFLPVPHHREGLR